MGNRKPKPLDQVLRKPGVMLEEVLDNESVLAKARSGDSQLSHFLGQPEILHQMLSKLVEASFEPEEKRMRYPFVCCELLLLHLDCLLELLKLEANALEVIWAYLQASERIDSQILVYITRILAALFSKSSKTMFAIIKERGHVFDLFVRHLENTPAADFLCRVIEMESSTCKVLQFLSEEGFFGRILHTIGSMYTEGRHFALYQFINGLLMRPFPETYPILSLIHRFTETNVMGMYMSLLFDSSNNSASSWKYGLGLLSTICEKIHETTEMGLNTTNVVHEFSMSLAPRIGVLRASLDADEGVYNSPMGQVPRLGTRKITATRILADVSFLRSAEIISEMKRLEVAEKMFSLFFSHTQNTFLHTNVVDFFTNICHGDWNLTKPIIIDSVIRKSKLFARISQAQRIADSFAELPRRARPNFMGHITLLADQIHALLDKHSAEMYKEVGDLLRRESWMEYSNKSYRETKLKDAYILGGEQAPHQPVIAEEVYTSVFTTSADEAIVRYFCHEVISNFPPSLHLTDIDIEMEIDSLPDDDDDDGDMMIDDEPSRTSASILGSTLLGSRDDGFANLMSFDLDIQYADDDDDEAFDLGPDSEDDHLFSG